MPDGSAGFKPKDGLHRPRPEELKLGSCLQNQVKQLIASANTWIDSTLGQTL